MSSASFSTRNSLTDYDYIGKEISTSNPINTTFHFEMKELFRVEEELMVLECDFYYFNFDSEKVLISFYCQGPTACNYEREVVF